MVLDKNKFSEVKYTNAKFGKHSLFFDFKVDKYCKHENSNKTFKFYETLLKFLSENPNKQIYMTLEKALENFKEIDNKTYLINFEEFQRFCKKNP